MPLRPGQGKVQVAPVTVLLPTIGRPDLVRRCLESLADCAPRAEEIIVIDSSKDDAVARIVSAFAEAGTRAIRCPQPGIGAAFNLGLREARHEFVLLTNDDCTVERSWVERGHTHARATADAIVTGRVRPDGDPRAVPSTIEDVEARHYAGRPDFVLYTQCMALARTTVLDFGGFDEDVRPSAEDNDLSYRWLRAGRRIHYEPDFVVWHHDWRTRDQLERLYVSYGIGQGMVYGKHLRRGDLLIARYLLGDLLAGCRGVVARAVRGPRPYADSRLGLLRGLPVGLARGWRAARASSTSHAEGGGGDV